LHKMLNLPEVRCIVFYAEKLLIKSQRDPTFFQLFCNVSGGGQKLRTKIEKS
jgi:hypothetical protein